MAWNKIQFANNYLSHMFTRIFKNASDACSIFTQGGSKFIFKYCSVNICFIYLLMIIKTFNIWTGTTIIDFIVIYLFAMSEFLLDG